jgi:non-canonical purine NTP pyrophosphatase (RdgB/HAM1 family)
MKPFVFVTGNEAKVKYLQQWLGMPVEHHALDLVEIQSLDAREVIEYKAKEAYAQLQRPVLVEDVSLTFTAMGRLPGTFIKWFLEDVGTEGLARLADGLPHRSAVAAIIYGYYDGHDLRVFEGRAEGTIAPTPRGDNIFGKKGWNTLFIPAGQTRTYAEMTDEEIRPLSHRAHAIEKLKEFLL